ncbi:hypothetical protein KKB44_04035 [Candidatus Micrarchaeota archaeon]|nr:hypothetical protein [Candidatus Micrarchaeota archaeon]
MARNSFTFQDFRQARCFVRLIFKEYGKAGGEVGHIVFGEDMLGVKTENNVLFIEGNNSEVDKWKERYENFKPTEREFEYYYPCWSIYGPLRDSKIIVGGYSILPCENQEDYPRTGKLIVALTFKVKAYDESEALEIGYFEVRKILPIISTLLGVWMGPIERAVSGMRLTSIGSLNPEGIHYKILKNTTEFSGDSKGWRKIDVAKARNLFSRYSELPKPKKERFESACRAYNLAQQFSGIYPGLGGGCLRSCLDTLTYGKARNVLKVKYKEGKLYSDISNVFHNDIIPEHSIKHFMGQTEFELFPEKHIEDANRFKKRKWRLYDIVHQEIEEFLIGHTG